MISLILYFQLFWEKRLQGLQARDSSHDPIQAMDLPRNMQRKIFVTPFTYTFKTHNFINLNKNSPDMNVTPIRLKNYHVSYKSYLY